MTAEIGGDGMYQEQSFRSSFRPVRLVGSIEKVAKLQRDPGLALF